ncbi:eukaryotic translation initiation factor 4E-1A-like isoform X2 [Heptranchias perlo]|uniref:eukaryotic translation initiation factor 4E-1A-like isoform X2 n=1 Tax=Heptranchias perlo TaxID=212740 RepID=UPI00355A0078
MAVARPVYLTIQESEETKKFARKENLTVQPYMKHPLQNRWTLWFFKNDKSKPWQANLRLVTKFDTVEDFWALYNYIQLASRLMSGCDYSLFKDGIEPMWEDNRNKCGGRWLITLSKYQRMFELDQFWLETLLCLIGEAFDDYSDDVCGAVINVRSKGDKIAIWTTDTENEEAVLYIGMLDLETSSDNNVKLRKNLQGKAWTSCKDCDWLSSTCRHSYKEWTRS